MTDKFAPPSGKEYEMMLTCEQRRECGRPLFIAAGREGAQRHPLRYGPECGAPKSKFMIDVGASAQASPPGPASGR